MSAYRNFDAEQRERAGEGVPFTIGGRDFRTKPTLPLGALVRFQIEQRKEDADVMALLQSVFNRVLPTEQVPVMESVILDSDADLATFMDLVAWLIEQAAAVPTQQPSTSSTGASSTGPSSTASSGSSDLMRAVTQLHRSA